MNKRLYRALLAVFGDGQIFTAADVLKRSGFVAAPKFRELRLAIEAVLGPKLGAIKIGKWLEAHRDTEAGELRLSGEYDSHIKRWRYCVFTMATIEQIESELAESAQRFVEAREKEMVGKSLEQRLKQSERDLLAIELLNEQRRTFESDRKYEERKAAEAAEAKPKPLNIFLAPARGYFLFESKTEKLVNDLCELGFNASMGYLSNTRFIIWIDGEIHMKSLKRAASRFLVIIHETEDTPKTSKLNAEIALQEPPWVKLGYNPDREYLERAMMPDYQRERIAHSGQPFLEFVWPVFD